MIYNSKCSSAHFLFPDLMTLYKSLFKNYGQRQIISRHRCHLLITKYLQPCSLVEFAGKTGTFYRSTDLQPRSEARRFDRTDRLLHRHRSCASTIRTSEASTTEVNALKDVVGNHSSKLTLADGWTIVPAERRTMSIPVKVDHATHTKRGSKRWCYSRRAQKRS